MWQPELRDHYRPTDKPERTLEALQVFFPRHAEAILAELCAGRTVGVQGGDALNLVGVLAEQGFELRPSR